jgi:hypothetical protein
MRDKNKLYGMESTLNKFGEREITSISMLKKP